MSRLRKFYPVLMALAVLLGAAGCKSHKKMTVRASASAEIVRVPEGISDLQKQIVEEAYSWMGTPYQYSGEEKGVGTDCSGMVLRVYEKVEGVKIPRNSAKQAEFCIPLESKEVETGDLVFFATGKDPDKVSHVGIMLDAENFIHASTSKGVVVSKVTTPYYTRTFKMYGRVPH